jgi:hypothetical protein
VLFFSHIHLLLTLPLSIYLSIIILSGAAGPGGPEFAEWAKKTEADHGVVFLKSMAELPAIPEGTKRLALVSGRTGDNPRFLGECIAVSRVESNPYVLMLLYAMLSRTVQSGSYAWDLLPTYTTYTHTHPHNTLMFSLLVITGWMQQHLP